VTLLYHLISRLSRDYVLFQNMYTSFTKILIFIYRVSLLVDQCFFFFYRQIKKSFLTYLL